MSRRPLVLLALVAASAAHAQTDVVPNLWTTDGPVEGIAVLGDTLYVSGSFGYVGPPTGQLAVLDKTTGEADLAWPRFESVWLLTDGIEAVVPDGAGGFFVGGDFSFVSGRRRDNLAHVLADGTLDPAFAPDPGFPASPLPEGHVFALALDTTAASPSGAGVLYIGGRFTSIGGESRDDVAALDAATGAVLPFRARPSSQSGDYYRVRALGVLNGVVYIGGYFDAVDGVAREGVAALDGVSGAVLAWDAGLSGPNSFDYADAVAVGDSTVYLSGAFEAVRGQARPYIAEVTAADPATGEGGVPTPWRPSSPAGFSGARDLAVVGDYLFAADAFFNRVDRRTGAVRRLLPGYELAGALAYDSTAASPSGAGVVYVGLDRRDGAFDRSLVVAAVDAGTGIPLAFEVLGGTDEDPSKQVRALAVTAGPGGRVVAGGNFVSLGGVARYSLAGLDLTTGRPTDLDLGLESLFAEDLAVSPDGRYLYGHLREVGAISLKELDLQTGAVREFFPPGRVAAESVSEGGAVPLPAVGPADPAARRATSLAPRAGGTPGGQPGGTPYVANGPSALVVTEDRVCLSILVCLDRATTDVVWQQSGAIYLARDNGDVLLVPPGGDGGPGGASGTLYVAAPLAEVPAGRPHAGFVALDFATGAVLPFEVSTPPENGPEAFAVARLDTDGAGPAATTVYFGGDRVSTVQGQPRLNTFAVAEPSAALVPWSPRIQGGAAFFPWEPVMSMLAVPRRAEDGGGGVVYVAGASGPIGLPLGGAVAFDAETGAVLPWDVRPDGEDITTGHVRHVLASPRHGAVFLAGGFLGVLRGSGHAGVVAVSPAAPFAVAGESGAAAPAASALALAGPNPFRSWTTLALSLPGGGRVEAALYDVLGRRVAVLHDGALAAGAHTLAVDASSLPAGVYVARVAGPGVAASVTLTVVR